MLVLAGFAVFWLVLVGRVNAAGLLPSTVVVAVDPSDAAQLRAVVGGNATTLLVAPGGTHPARWFTPNGDLGRTLRAGDVDGPDAAILATDAAGESSVLAPVRLSTSLLVVAPGRAGATPYTVDVVEPSWTALLTWPWHALALLAVAGCALALAATVRPRP